MSSFCCHHGNQYSNDHDHDHGCRDRVLPTTTTGKIPLLIATTCSCIPSTKKNAFLMFINMTWMIVLMVVLQQPHSVHASSSLSTSFSSSTSSLPSSSSSSSKILLRDHPKAILTSTTTSAKKTSQIEDELDTLRSLGMSTSEIESLLGGGTSTSSSSSSSSSSMSSSISSIIMDDEYDEESYEDNEEEYELYDDDEEEGNEEDNNIIEKENSDDKVGTWEEDKDAKNDNDDDWWKDPFARFGEKNMDEEMDNEDSIVQDEEKRLDEDMISDTSLDITDDEQEKEEENSILDLDGDEEDTTEDLIMNEPQTILDDNNGDEEENDDDNNEGGGDLENDEIIMTNKENEENIIIDSVQAMTLQDENDDDETVDNEEENIDEYEYDEEYYDDEEEVDLIADDENSNNDDVVNRASSNIGSKSLSKQSTTPTSGIRSLVKIPPGSKSKSVSTIAIPSSIILSKLANNVIKSPLIIPVFAAATLGNIILHRIGTILNKNKKNRDGKDDEEMIDNMSFDGEGDNEEFYDVDELEFTDDGDIYTEDVTYGRPIQKKAQLMEEHNDEERIDKKKKRFVFWGSKKDKSNKPTDFFKNANSNDEADNHSPLTSSSTSSIEKLKKKGFRNLFGFHNNQLREEMEAQLDEIEALRERSSVAEVARDKIESDYDEVLQRLKDAQTQLMEVTRTNTYLKNELRDNKNILERAISAERQKTNSELARVRDQMVAVLERERRIMRAQLMKSSEEVRSMIAHSDERDYGDDIGYEEYNYDAGDI